MDGQLLDVSVAATSQSDVNSTLENLEAGLTQIKDQIVLSVKVLGENRFLVVVTNDKVEGVTRRINEFLGVSLKTRPIMAYETFARETTGIEDSDIAEKKPPAKIDYKKPLYFLDFTVEYAGKSMEELLAAWKKEAVAALALQYGGSVAAYIYKVVASRQVVAFLQLDSSAADGASFKLPIMPIMGDQVQITSRLVRAVTD